ncbi:MAG: MFS transporter [Ignisphaera sp.]|nr:MFS transporter [Ignisphaera sp.]MDW8085705.1 MFS transporter [Ignisphaera sp.]
MRILHKISLLCLGFTTISFIQFGLFGTALPLIVAELGIGYDLVGVLMALWILTSVIVAPVIGRYIDRVDILLVVFTILALLSASSLLTAFSTNLVTLTVARVLLSFSMPFVWPICAKITSMYSSSDRYGYSTALYDIGSIVGLALTYIVVAVIGSSWRSAMILASILGFAYIPIMATAWKYRATARAIADRSAGRNPIYEGRSMYRVRRRLIKLGLLLFLAFFSALYTWGFIVNWLSTLLVNELGYSYSYIALYMVFIAAVSSILEIIAGLYSDRIGGLWGKIAILYMGLTPAAVLLLSSTFFSSPTSRMVSISLSIITYRIATPSFWSIVNEVIPTSIVGRFGTIYTLAGPISGIVSSVVNGYIVAATNSVKYGVLLSSVLLFLSILLYSTINRLYRRYGLS